MNRQTIKKHLAWFLSAISAFIKSTGDHAKAILTIAALIAGIESVWTGWIPMQLGKFFGVGVESSTALLLEQEFNNYIKTGQQYVWTRSDSPNSPAPTDSLQKAQGPGTYLICWGGNGNYVFSYKSLNGNEQGPSSFGSDYDCKRVTGKEFRIKSSGSSLPFYWGNVYVYEFEKPVTNNNP